MLFNLLETPRTKQLFPSSCHPALDNGPRKETSGLGFGPTVPSSQDKHLAAPQSCPDLQTNFLMRQETAANVVQDPEGQSSAPPSLLGRRESDCPRWLSLLFRLDIWTLKKTAVGGFGVPLG